MIAPWSLFSAPQHTCSWGKFPNHWILSTSGWSERLLLVLSAPWCSENPCSQSLCLPEGRLVSGLKLTSPHTVFCTVIHSRVLGGHSAHLQGEQVLGQVSGDGDSTSEWWILCWATPIIDAYHPFYSLRWWRSNQRKHGRARGPSRAYSQVLTSSAAPGAGHQETEWTMCSLAASPCVHVWIPETLIIWDLPPERERITGVSCSFRWGPWLWKIFSTVRKNMNLSDRMQWFYLVV